jgi:hypothetical protein
MIHEAYPLSWPIGFKRTQYRSRSKFKSPSFSASRDGLLAELRRLGARDIVLSTNIPLRLDGLPYAGMAQPKDPGVAVYFKMKGKATSIACDRWQKIEDNVHALELTIAAMRGLDRWGASDMLDRVFTGFTALPAPSDESHKPWWEVLGCGRQADLEFIEDTYRREAKRHHPDVGGSPLRMASLNSAIEQARIEKGAR